VTTLRGALNLLNKQGVMPFSVERVGLFRDGPEERVDAIQRSCESLAP